MACWIASCALLDGKGETDALIEKAKASSEEERTAALERLLERRGKYTERQIGALLLSEGSVQLRVRLIQLLGETGDLRFNRELIRMLADQNQEVASAAEDSLGELLDGKLESALFDVALSATESPAVKTRIVRILSRDATMRNVGLFIGLLDTDDPGLKRTLFEALQDITQAGLGTDEESWQQWWQENRKKSQTQWMHEVMRRLEEENRNLRSEIELLNERHRRELTALRGEAADAFIAQLKKRPDRNDMAPLVEALNSKYRQVVVYSLKELASTAPGGLPEDLSRKILGMLASPAPDVRAWAAAALASSADAGVVAPLQKLLDDKEPLVRGKAAEALGKLGDKTSSQQLRTLLKDAALEVRRAAIEAIGKLGAKDATGDLIALLSDKDADMRWEAARALGSIRAPDAVDALIGILNDENPRVRWYASDALGKIGDGRAVEPLIKKLDDPDPGVRENVLDSLMALNDQRALDAFERKIGDGEKRVSAKAWDVYVALASRKKDTLKGSCEKYLATGQYGRALELFDKYVEVYGSDSPTDEIYARVNMAKIYLFQDRVKEAMAVFKELVGEYPGYLEPRREYFSALFERKSFDEAAEHLTVLIAKDSRRKEEYFQKSLIILESLFEQKKFERLIDLVAKLEAADAALGGDEMKNRIIELRSKSEAALKPPLPKAPPEEPPRPDESKKETPSAEEK